MTDDVAGFDFASLEGGHDLLFLVEDFGGAGEACSELVSGDF